PTNICGLPARSATACCRATGMATAPWWRCSRLCAITANRTGFTSRAGPITGKPSTDSTPRLANRYFHDVGGNSSPLGQSLTFRPACPGLVVGPVLVQGPAGHRRPADERGAGVAVVGRGLRALLDAGATGSSRDRGGKCCRPGPDRNQAGHAAGKQAAN